MHRQTFPSPEIRFAEVKSQECLRICWDAEGRLKELGRFDAVWVCIDIWWCLICNLLLEQILGDIGLICWFQSVWQLEAGHMIPLWDFRFKNCPKDCGQCELSIFKHHKFVSCCSSCNFGSELTLSTALPQRNPFQRIHIRGAAACLHDSLDGSRSWFYLSMSL